MITHSDAITKLMTALHKVQGEVDGVPKDSVNPHFKNRYASLESVVDAIRGPCQSAGIVVTQAPGGIDGNTIALTTMITHAESGEWLKSTIQLPMAKQDPQGAGSAISYSARYSLMALFCLPAVDDDGEAAQRPATRPQPPVQQHTGIQAQPVFATPLRSAIRQMQEQATPDALLAWFRQAKPKTEGWPQSDLNIFHTEYEAHMADLQEQKRKAG